MPTDHVTADQERVAAILEAVEGEDVSLADAVRHVMEGAPTHLRTADLEDPGDPIEIAADPMPPSDLERIVGPSNLMPVHFLEEGAERQRAVARVALKQSHAGLPAGAGWGTGFLVGHSILMTNNHVIPSVAFAKKVRAEFDYQLEHTGAVATPDVWDLDPDDLFYTNAALDVTIVRVRCRSMLLTLPSRALVAGGEVDDEAIELTELEEELSPTGEASLVRTATGLNPSFTGRRRLIPLCLSPGNRYGRVSLPSGAIGYGAGQRYNIVQHPQGRRKEVALQSNTFSVLFTTAVRYTTDTEPGSSGSPVFDNGWDLVAIHHAGGSFVDGAWVNNEGMRMDRIVADLRSQYPAGSTVRAQLGI